MRHNDFIKNRLRTDVKFCLIHNTGRQIHCVPKSKTESNSRKDVSELDFDSYKRWIEFQQTLDIKWLNIEINHLNTISFLDVSKDEDLHKAFNWLKIQPLSKISSSQRN